MARVRFPDPFNAVLLSSPVLVVTPEQNQYIRDILEICCSDSRFAEKAYVALTKVLTSGPVVPPVITSLTPSTAVIGSESFTLSVVGTGFESASEIMWNGMVEPTVYVSATELTTGVDMSTATTAMDIPVAVVNSNGVMSDFQTFSLIDPAARTTSPVKQTLIPAVKHSEPQVQTPIKTSEVKKTGE